eukprot:m51a1_g62 hypothetical protein (780) ;mRNA; r:207807-210373
MKSPLWETAAVCLCAILVHTASAQSPQSCVGTLVGFIPTFSTSGMTTLFLTVPPELVLNIRPVAGASWSFKFGGNRDRLNKLRPSIDFKQLGDTSFSADVGSPLVSPASALVSSAALAWSACCAVVLASCRARWAAALVATAALSHMALARPAFVCQNGELVVEYPAGAQVFINGAAVPTCGAATPSPQAVQQPTLAHSVADLGTFWFTSPVVVDLDAEQPCTNCKEIIACAGRACYVFDPSIKLLQKITLDYGDRSYAAPVVTDLDGNGKIDLCVAAGAYVFCYEWIKGQFVSRAGFPVFTAVGELRGLAAADIDHDGLVEVFASSTNSSTQIFAFKPDGKPVEGWPRYNTLTGATGDADPGNGVYDGRNGYGHSRYGSYGLNIGIGNIDDNADLEIMATYDDHQLQAFKKDGSAINMAATFTNPSKQAKGKPVTWGQATPRWTNATTDNGMWVTHACWPYPVGAGDNNTCKSSGTPCVSGGDEWLQFTQSPPTVVDLDYDGENEVAVVPTSEKGMNERCDGYKAMASVLTVFDGAYGNNGDAYATNLARSGLRHKGFDGDMPPRGSTATCQECTYTRTCTCRNKIYYPPGTVPALATGNIVGTEQPELITSLVDGKMYCFNYNGTTAWVFDFAAAAGIDPQVHAIESTEPVIADLNRDGKPEVIFATYGYPTNPPSKENNQHLFILSNEGVKLIDIKLNTKEAAGGDTRFNGNGNGPAGAPTVVDFDGDGTLEILLNTFDGRLLIYTVPGSSANCILWPSGRGGYLRKGQPDHVPNY